MPPAPGPPVGRAGGRDVGEGAHALRNVGEIGEEVRYEPPLRSRPSLTVGLRPNSTKFTRRLVNLVRFGPWSEERGPGTGPGPSVPSGLGPN